jgi:hypothetical protein
MRRGAHAEGDPNTWLPGFLVSETPPADASPFYR